MLKLRRDSSSECFAERLDVVLETLVVEHRQFFRNFGGCLSAKLHIILDCVAVLRRHDLRLCPDSKREHADDTEPGECAA
jgi:hypothetical protein